MVIKNKTINDLEENGFTLFDSNSEMIEPTIHMFKKTQQHVFIYVSQVNNSDQFRTISS